MPLPPAFPDVARRRRRREAVFGSGQAAGWAEPGPPSSGGRPRVVTGTVLDASPHLLVLSAHEPDPAAGTCRRTERRLPMTPATSIWHGGRAGPHALTAGREVLVRRSADGPGIDRIWVDIARVSGTILASTRETVELDSGPHRGRTHVVIPPHALARVLVRHPRPQPGYLMDLICVRSPDGPLAVQPGTAQPGHLAPHPRHASGSGAPARVQGTATWYGTLGCAPHGRGAAGRSTVPADWAFMDGSGAAYPAVDPEGSAGGCADAPAGCAPLPYLSIGSELLLRNECSGATRRVPVVECGCLAARFCDRCVECEASPRGRIVELTPAAFVGLGGDLARGCFNVSLSGTLDAGGGA